MMVMMILMMMLISQASFSWKPAPLAACLGWYLDINHIGSSCAVPLVSLWYLSLTRISLSTILARRQPSLFPPSPHGRLRISVSPYPPISAKFNSSRTPLTRTQRIILKRRLSIHLVSPRANSGLLCFSIYSSQSHEPKNKEQSL